MLSTFIAIIIVGCIIGDKRCKAIAWIFGVLFLIIGLIVGA